MKQMARLLALVAALVVANPVEAGGPPFPPQPYPYPAPGAGYVHPHFASNPNDSGYGWSPKAAKWFHRPQYSAPAPAPIPPGGTLVFPNHPFARSPRDFFMLD